MTRFLILFSFVILSLNIFGQVELKSKYWGVYEGEIKGYKMDMGDGLINVKPTDISIEINSGILNMSIGDANYAGEYSVLFEAKTYFVLEGTLEGQNVVERIIVYKKGKTISRDGLFPQPSALLKKIGK